MTIESGGDGERSGWHQDEAGHDTNDEDDEDP
jgi:hypothetical protein